MAPLRSRLPWSPRAAKRVKLVVRSNLGSASTLSPPPPPFPLFFFLSFFLLTSPRCSSSLPRTMLVGFCGSLDRSLFPENVCTGTRTDSMALKLFPAKREKNGRKQKQKKSEKRVGGSALGSRHFTVVGVLERVTRALLPTLPVISARRRTTVQASSAARRPLSGVGALRGPSVRPPRTPNARAVSRSNSRGETTSTALARVKSKPGSEDELRTPSAVTVSRRGLICIIGPREFRRPYPASGVSLL